MEIFNGVYLFGGSHCNAGAHMNRIFYSITPPCDTTTFSFHHLTLPPFIHFTPHTTIHSSHHTSTQSASKEINWMM